MQCNDNLFAEAENNSNPNRRKALAALIIWSLLAVGDDIYVSQIQPRLSEKGVCTPNLPDDVDPKPYRCKK